MSTIVLNPTPPARKATSWTFGLVAGLSIVIAGMNDPGRDGIGTFAAIDSSAVETTIEEPAARAFPVLDPTIAEREALAAEVARYRPDRSGAFHRDVAGLIIELSEEEDFDPFFVASLIGVESSFDPESVSRVGAIGLMQLRPFVAESLADEDPEVEWTDASLLFDPETNIRLGLRYYASLLNTFDGDHAKALSAYNYGPTRIRRWVREGTYRDTGYAAKILAAYEGHGGSLSAGA